MTQHQHAQRLYLASASPRRRVLLPLLGYPVETVVAEIDESPLLGELPAALARRLASGKAQATGQVGLDQYIIAADTVVALDNLPIAKPNSPEEARRMLTGLRGRTHGVITGVALRTATHEHVGAVETRVVMRDYSDDEIQRSIASGQPFDKAGGYAIQDVDFRPVERIEGCYLNVVGLPLCEVAHGLRALGLPLPCEEFEPPCRYCRLGQEALER